ncbi:MAG: hypothetical protein LBP19_04825 [Treponema sp.]|nr:hypothetical protein [Treponema sp.]
MKNFWKMVFILVYITVSASAFADGNTSLIDPSAVEVNNFSQRDITAQIALREALIETNFYKIRDLHAQKQTLIEKEKLSGWDQMWDGRIKELDRQIKHYEDQNKRYEREIKQFTKKLK